jgi:hypothetical protein|tara:strand:- start:65 stop:265 length:201 start_codon:yes stop_codon:yes gene_type:complete
MKFSKSKATTRFNFELNRDTISHKKGVNRLVIGTRDSGTYGTTSSQFTLTVKEAKALQSFLNQHLG